MAKAPLAAARADMVANKEATPVEVTVILSKVGGDIIVRLKIKSS
jgi:hypothetical protein